MVRPPRFCALSVDLDEIPNYHAIHGLSPPEGAAMTAVYDVAIERFARFAENHELPLTFFAVGADLAREANSEKLYQVAKSGHEIANHSLDHLYNLTRLPSPEMVRQVEEASRAIELATGVRPVGFRAPGYVITDELVDTLTACGVEYDSSVFPCPPYYGAKALAMAWIALRGRRSRSIVDHPRTLLAPVRPYRLGRPFHEHGKGPVEFPIQVTPWLRLPFIGTALELAGPTRARWLTRLVGREPFVNLELHGIDLLDTADGLGGLGAVQPDLRVPLATKLAVFAEVVGFLRTRGFTFVRLDEASRNFPKG